MREPGGNQRFDLRTVVVDPVTPECAQAPVCDAGGRGRRHKGSPLRREVGAPEVLVEGVANLFDGIGWRCPRSLDAGGLEVGEDVCALDMELVSVSVLASVEWFSYLLNHFHQAHIVEASYVDNLS